MSLESTLVALIGRKDADEVFLELNRITNPDARHKILEETVALLTGASTKLADDVKWRNGFSPVGPEEFLMHPDFLGKSSEVYDEVLPHFIELNSGRYDEAVLTGGIGAAKTTVALYTQAYQLYLLSCLANPHAQFGLDSASEIKIIFQSLRLGAAKTVDFRRFKGLIDRSPYFKYDFPREQGVESILRFANRIEIEPVSGSETAAIGQNIIGGVIDEVNFMAVVENSKQSVDGGVYNQAVELYNSIARRRKSRFMKAGAMPGILCVVSSKRIPGEFTDVKMAEAVTNPRIFVYDKRVWDIKPDAFTGERFRVFIGDESRRPRIMAEDEILPEEDHELIDHVPIEFRGDFEDDITKALRDIAGHSTLASMPFLPNAQKVVACFSQDHKNISIHERVDFVKEICQVSTTFMRPELPRYAHLDLAISGDSAGVVIGHCSGFVKDESGLWAPKIVVDLVLEVAPPKGGEILFWKIRDLLFKLQELGLNIRWCSLDSFQSRDTIQILRQRGIATGILSMDTSMEPYGVLKTALYDGRVRIPEHKKLKKELLALEVDMKRKKVDHNALNSKDISDALAGVVYGLSHRREVWAMFGKQPVKPFKDNLKTDTAGQNMEAVQ